MSSGSVEDRLNRVELKLDNFDSHFKKLEDLMREMVEIQKTQLKMQNKIDRAQECCQEFKTCQIEGCKALGLANAETRETNIKAQHEREEINKELEYLKKRNDKLDDALKDWQELRPSIVKIVRLADNLVMKLVGAGAGVALISAISSQGFSSFFGG